MLKITNIELVDNSETKDSTKKEVELSTRKMSEEEKAYYELWLGEKK